MPAPSTLMTRLFRNLGFRSQQQSSKDTSISTLTLTRPFSQLSPTEKTIALSKSKPVPPAICPTTDQYIRQASCKLISKLPPELREIIWAHILGGNTIHIFWEDRNTLRGFICSRQKNCISMVHERNKRKELMWGTAAMIREQDICQEKGLMGLLVSCRAIYFEATKALYSKNTFDFTDHWPNFKYLDWSIPLVSLSQITSITMTCYGVPLPSPQLNFKNWKTMWEKLALLKGLRKVRIEVVPEKGGQPGNGPVVTRAMLSEKEDELLEPVGRADALVKETDKGRWDLVLPFEEKSNGYVARRLVEVGWRIERI